MATRLNDSGLTKWVRLRKYDTDKKWEMTLTDEEYATLCLQPCYYCGNLPSKVHCRHRRTEFHALKTNGIDRVNASLGYVSGNCVPCCETCNLMKSNIPLEIWVAHMKQIIAHTAATGAVAEVMPPASADVLTDQPLYPC